jgi:hypothetical protein
MADKYIKIGSNGNLEEVEATVQSAGAENAGDIPALGTDGKLDDTVMPDGIGAETQVMAASEGLSPNDVVNIFDDTGTTKCRKADATDATKPADGYVKAAVELGANATVYTDGYLPGTGLTVGSKYFLSADTPGAVTTTPPSGTGNIMQQIGKAVSPTAIKFEPLTPIVRA